MPTENRVKTLNGRPTTSSELALPEVISQPGIIGKVKLAYKNLNLILAGMYTGVTCYGVPHEEHTYKSVDSKEKSPD